LLQVLIVMVIWNVTDVVHHRGRGGRPAPVT